MPTAAVRRPAPQAPSTQMGPPAEPPRAAPPSRSPRALPSTPPVSLSPWSSELSDASRGNLHDQATLLEANALPDGPDHEPTPPPNISQVGFRPEGADNTDLLGAETIMTPNGGAARKAWRDLADAGAGPAQARFGGSAELDTPFSSLDLATDPELASGLEVGITATRPLASTISPEAGGARPAPPARSVLAADDPTELGQVSLPPSVLKARGMAPAAPTAPLPARTQALPSFVAPRTPPAEPPRTRAAPPAEPPRTRAAPPAEPSRTRAAPPAEPLRSKGAVPVYGGPAEPPLRAHVPPRPQAAAVPAYEPPSVPAADTMPLPQAGHTRKLPAAVAAGRRPDTPVAPRSLLDEPPNELTRLGELAGPASHYDDALVSVPVHGAPRGPVGPAETVAAPGELAGLISDLESRINARPPAPPVRDPKPLTERPAARTPERGVLPQPPPSASAVRKGLTSHLPVTPDPNEPSLVRPVPLTATDAELDEVDEDVDLDLGLDLREPPPLEETRAFLDVRLDQALSMPGEALSAARPMARNDTGPMPAMLPPQYLVGATEVESENRLEVASRVRRVLAALLDAALVFGLLTVPVLLELFGADVARASPIDPDDVTRLAMQGSLTLPAVAGAALVLLYITLTSALGRSLGKLAFGLRLVCNDTGERPGFGRALVRGAAALLFGVMLGLGPLWILVSRNARALHDVIAGTTVVRS